MRYLSLFCCALCLICSCRQRAHQPHSSDKKNDSIANEKALRHYLDSIHINFTQLIHEPLIDTYHHEVYRYWYSIVFHPDYIFRVEHVGEKWILISKWTQDEGEPGQGCIPVLVHGKERQACYGDILDTTIQELSTKQRETFINLLEGSYYRRLQESTCEDGIMDGSSIILEAMSESWCDLQTSLKYYRIGVHVPREGSFKEACKYLSKISLLTKNRQIQHWIWMY